MRSQDAVSILAALAQDNRLDVFRLLVEAGPEGMPAGHIASSLRLPPNALTFHLDRLREAGLVTVRREGRNDLYGALRGNERAHCLSYGPVLPETS